MGPFRLRLSMIVLIFLQKHIYCANLSKYCAIKNRCDYMRYNCRNHVLCNMASKDTIKDDISKLINSLADGKLGKSEFEEQINQTSNAISEKRAARQVLLSQAAIIGSAIYGFSFGVLADVTLSSIDINPTILPFLISCIFLAGAFYADSRPGQAKEFLSNYVGEPSLYAANQFSTLISDLLDSWKRQLSSMGTDAINYINAMPNKVKNIVIEIIDDKKAQTFRKIESTKNIIKNIPNALKLLIIGKYTDAKVAINTKIENALEEFKQIPTNILSAATVRANTYSNEVQQLPGKVSAFIKNQIETMVDKLKNSIRSIPQKLARYIDVTSKRISQIPSDLLNYAYRSIQITLTSIPKNLNNKISSIQESIVNAMPLFLKVSRVPDGEE